MVLRLIVLGILQALSAFLLAWLVHSVFVSHRQLSFHAAIGILAATALRFGLHIAEAREAEQLGQHYISAVRRKLFEAAAAQPQEQRHWGTAMGRLVTDLSSLRNWVSQGLARFISGSIALVGVLGVYFWFDAKGGLVVTIVCLVLLGWAAFLKRPLKEQVRLARKERGRLVNLVSEQFLMQSRAAEFERDNPRLRKLNKRSQLLSQILVRRAWLAALLRRSPDLGHGIALVGILSLGSRVQGGQIHPALSILLLGLIFPVLRDLARAWEYRTSFEVARNRMTELLRESPQVQPVQPPPERPLGPTERPFVTAELFHLRH